MPVPGSCPEAVMTGRDLFGFLIRPGGAAIPARPLPLVFSKTGSRGDTPSIQVPSWVEEVCKAMNPNTQGLTAAIVGERWAQALRRRFSGPSAAKRIARELGKDVRTAESWLAGQAPYLHVVVETAIRLKDPLLLFEIAGLAPPSDTEIAAKLGEIKGELDALGARIARLKADSP